jgi:GH25 family lysozyme M1 (1,4-beta-N-acetylmuramidase)
MATFYGFDFSRWQGTINWGLVAQNAAFGFYKGTGGDDGLYVDSQFLNNHAGARASGIAHGIYHFGGNGDATAEADYFYQQCLTNLVPGEVVVLDAETENALDPGWCLTFLQHLESLIGFKPLIYMNQNSMLTKDWSAVAAADYGLWLADWNGDPNANVTMKYWSFCAFQQYADNATVPGVDGNVDADAFFAPDMSYFVRYGKPTQTPPPVVTPAPVDPTPTQPTEPTPSEPTPTPEPTPVPLPEPPTTEPTPTQPVPPVPDTPTPPVVITTSSEFELMKAVLVRVFHTFWQSFAAVFVVSITGLTSTLLSVHTLSDAKSFGLALVAAAIAAALSAVKNLIVTPKEAVK